MGAVLPMYYAGIDEVPVLNMPEPPFRFIDLFAGIGGMRLPFEKHGGECVFTSEWDKFAVKTYKANFESGHEVAGDITQIPEEEIPPHDVLLAGFPCQPFSIAGVSKKNALGRPHGFLCGTQGTLFFDIARILARHQPRAFVLENVKHLLRHDKGHTFQVIRDTLENELQYTIGYRIIDAQGFVPQHRERTVIVGFRDAADFDFAMEDIRIPAADSGPKLAAILHPENGEEPAEPPYTEGAEAVVNEKYTLTAHLWEYLQAYAAKHQAMGNGFGFGLVGPADTARTLSARYFKDGSEILIQRPDGRPRRLTPRECSRLMGFDWYAGRPWCIPVSDTQAYRQFGNALVPQMIDAVAEFVVPRVTAPPKAALSGGRALAAVTDC